MDVFTGALNRVRLAPVCGRMGGKVPSARKVEFVGTSPDRCTSLRVGASVRSTFYVIECSKRNPIVEARNSTTKHRGVSSATIATKCISLRIIRSRSLSYPMRLAKRELRITLPKSGQGRFVSISPALERLESLRPILVGLNWKGLIDAQIGRTDGSEHEVLRGNWAARQPS